MQVLEEKPKVYRSYYNLSQLKLYTYSKIQFNYHFVFSAILHEICFSTYFHRSFQCDWYEWTNRQPFHDFTVSYNFWNLQFPVIYSGKFLTLNIKTKNAYVMNTSLSAKYLQNSAWVFTN